ncbi:MAG TPA: twin-arginine translocase TatA/TatE family subunit [Dissulfurispiraceae bacterium]|nr:twin-arginine translocase TatA/TatE family subunit [Dissulfurispiraceae bacterium]
MFSLQDSLVILAIVLVLFGGKRLPEIASGMGKAIKGFKKELSKPDEIEIIPEKNDSSKKDVDKQDSK